MNRKHDPNPSKKKRGIHNHAAKGRDLANYDNDRNELNKENAASTHSHQEITRLRSNRRKGKAALVPG